MKKELACIVSSCVLCAACTAGTSETQIKIARAYQKEGDVYQSQGNYTAALSKLLEAEQIIPHDPYLQNSLGLAYMGKKRYDLAAQSFSLAVKYKADYTEAMNNLGAAYLRQEKWDAAISQFNQVLEDILYPTPHFPLVNIGWAYYGKGHYSKAQTFFLKALDERPGFVTAIHGLARVYLSTGQTDRAITYLNRNLEKMPEAAILHADIAEAFEQKGLRMQAFNAWKIVCELAPEYSSLAKRAADRVLMLQP